MVKVGRDNCIFVLYDTNKQQYVENKKIIIPASKYFEFMWELGSNLLIIF